MELYLYVPCMPSWCRQEELSLYILYFQCLHFEDAAIHNTSADALRFMFSEQIKACNNFHVLGVAHVFKTVGAAFLSSYVFYICGLTLSLIRKETSYVKQYSSQKPNFLSFSRPSPCGICGGQGDPVKSFSRHTLVFPSNHHSTSAP
jgi:hypothetical protein